MSVRGFKLPTKFYVWFRTNVEQIALMADQENASAQRIAAKLKWPRAADMKRAIQLIKTHGAAIHAGDWTGVEKDLFAHLCAYYLELPSVMRALHELGDPRITSTPPSPRKRPAKRRGKRGAAGQGGTGVSLPIPPTAPTPQPAPSTPVAPPVQPTSTVTPKPPEAVVSRAPNPFRKDQRL